MAQSAAIALPSAKPQTKQDYLRRMGQLQADRSGWFGLWRDLSDNFQPQRGRFLATDRNKGYRRFDAIINNTPLISVRTLAAGMMSGITSPARLWFRLTTTDPDLNEFESVKEWMELVENRMFEVFAKSNAYNALQTGYIDLGVFGTHVAIVEEDHDDVIRLYCPPIGRYYLANSARQTPDTLFREDSMTVGQLVEDFGLSNCSPFVQNQFRAGNFHNWVDIVHVIEPNRQKEPGKLDRHGKSWRSCWFERSGGATLQSVDAGSPMVDDRFLHEGGFDEFPVLAPRWYATPPDVYGSSAAMEVLGEARALQLSERRADQLVDKLGNPPMVASTAARNSRLSLLPGDVSYVDGVQSGPAFRPAMEVNPQAVAVLAERIGTRERRIRSGLFADLFLMLANDPDPSNKTAREIAERHEEKLIALGPVLESVNKEYLAPLVARTLHIMLGRGLIPPPPQELQGQEYKVEFISTLSQAQKLLGVTSNDRAAQFALQFAEVKPDVLDKVDFDAMVEDQFDRLGVSPKIVVPQDQVQKARAARAQQQAQAQQQQQMFAATQGAKNLAQSPTDGQNALTDLANALGPGAAAAAGGGA